MKEKNDIKEIDLDNLFATKEIEIHASDEVIYPMNNQTNQVFVLDHLDNKLAVTFHAPQLGVVAVQSDVSNDKIKDLLDKILHVKDGKPEDVKDKNIDIRILSAVNTEEIKEKTMDLLSFFKSYGDNTLANINLLSLDIGTEYMPKTIKFDCLNGTFFETEY